MNDNPIDFHLYYRHRELDFERKMHSLREEILNLRVENESLKKDNLFLQEQIKTQRFFKYIELKRTLELERENFQLKNDFSALQHSFLDIQKRLRENNEMLTSVLAEKKTEINAVKEEYIIQERISRINESFNEQNFSMLTAEEKTPLKKRRNV